MKTFILTSVLLLQTVLLFSQKEITDSQKQLLFKQQDTLVVLEFSATWCAPCQYVKSITQKLQKEFKNSVVFYTIDVDKNELDDILNVNSMPTFVLYRNGKEIERLTQVLPEENMRAFIEFYSLYGIPKAFSQESIDKYWNDWQKLNTLAWYAYEKVSERDVLNRALKMTERSITLDKNAFNVDTYAALLYKTKNYNKALEQVNHAIQLAKEEGLSTKSSKKLRKKIKRAIK